MHFMDCASTAHTLCKKHEAGCFSLWLLTVQLSLQLLVWPAFFFFFPPLSQFHPLFTTTCQHLAAQQQHVFLVQLYGWDSVTNIQLSQDKTTACVMFSIVCSPLGNLLTKTKILFAKFMGVDEKVRWLPGLWCFCHYKKVCSARCVW